MNLASWAIFNPHRNDAGPSDALKSNSVEDQLRVIQILIRRYRLYINDGHLVSNRLISRLIILHMTEDIALRGLKTLASV